MPKRTTRGRKKPNQIFEDDVNTSVAVNDELQMKKDTFVADFDLQVKKIVRSMQSEVKKISSNMELMMTTYLVSSLPENIKKMTIEEFAAQGGNFQTLTLDEVTETIEEKVLTKRLPLTDQTNAKSKPGTLQKPLNKKSKRPAATKEAQLITSSSRVTRSSARTVQQSTTQSSQFVTPMCNPRSAPLTTSRKPKKNETVAYSINNSPLEITTPSIRPDMKYFEQVFDCNSPQFLTKVQKLLDKKMQSVVKEASR